MSMWANVQCGCPACVYYYVYTLTLQGVCKLVSPVSLSYHDNSKSNFHLSSSHRRRCPGEGHCSLVVSISVGNSKVILYTASEEGTRIKLVTITSTFRANERV